MDTGINKDIINRIEATVGFISDNIKFERSCMNLKIKSRIRFLGFVVICILFAAVPVFAEVPETVTDELCIFTWQYDTWLEGKIPWNGDTLHIALTCNKNDSAAIEKRLADFHTLAANLPAREKGLRAYITKKFGAEYGEEALETLKLFIIRIDDGRIDYFFGCSSDLFPSDLLGIVENSEGVIETAMFISWQN